MKDMIRILVLSMLLAALPSCGPTMSAEQKERLEATANKPVLCKAGADCDDKWNRAIVWVNKNSDYKINTVSDNLIQTQDIVSTDGKPVLHVPAFTIVKYKRSENIYVIDFSTACEKDFKCGTPGFVLKARFVQFVRGAN